MAETYYAALRRTARWDRSALAACLQLDACIPNFLVQEHVTLGDGYLKEPFEIVDGYIDVPQQAGPGDRAGRGWRWPTRLDDGSWETPRLWHADGSVADW